MLTLHVVTGDKRYLDSELKQQNLVNWCPGDQVVPDLPMKWRLVGGRPRQGHQFSVWGNGLIFPLAGNSEQQSIVRFYRDNRAKIFLNGCTREIAEPGGWEGNVNPGKYQNGGFWATGAGYVLPALAQLDPALCIELIGDLTANLPKIDFAEWLDATGKANGTMK
jgi:hypothetical protein